MDKSGNTAYTKNHWAREVKIANNPVRQLLVPESELRIEGGEGTDEWVVGNCGRWPARRNGKASQTGDLTALLPQLTANRSRVAWSGSRDFIPSDRVTKSYA